MTGVLDTVDQRTNLVGQNRLELLLFRLGSPQIYGINVFKVKEVIRCPHLNQIPRRHMFVPGIAHIRGTTITVIDLGYAIGEPKNSNYAASFMIVTEYNRTTQGFLVQTVEKIVNIRWDHICPPPPGVGKGNYLTAVTEIDQKLVEILDVEKILAEISPQRSEVSAGMIDQTAKAKSQSVKRKIFIADDSTVARKQVAKTLEQLGIEVVAATNGQEALDMLREMAKKSEAQGKKITDEIAMLISDIEMPQMDGYTLTTEIRMDPLLKPLYILLHTSLSGVFNKNMVEKVGADNFIAKFQPDLLAGAVQEHLKTLG